MMVYPGNPLWLRSPSSFQRSKNLWPMETLPSPWHTPHSTSFEVLKSFPDFLQTWQGYACHQKKMTYKTASAKKRWSVRIPKNRHRSLSVIFINESYHLGDLTSELRPA